MAGALGIVDDENRLGWVCGVGLRGEQNGKNKMLGANPAGQRARDDTMCLSGGDSTDEKHATYKNEN